MLVAGLTLLPALLSILGRAVFWPSKIVAGELHESWWGKVAQRVVARPAPHALDRPRRLRRARARGRFFYAPAGFGGATAAPSGTDAAAGNAALAKYFPQASSNPDQPHPSSSRTRSGRTPRPSSRRSISSRPPGCSTRLPGPARPRRRAHPAGRPTCTCTTRSGTRRCCRRCLRRVRPARRYRRRCTTLIARRPRFVSPDGHTIQFEAGLTAGDAGSTPALNAVPAIRDGADGGPAQHRRHRERRRGRGRRPLRRELDLRQRPHPHRPDRDPRDRDPARARAAQPDRAALPDRERAVCPTSPRSVSPRSCSSSSAVAAG